MPAELRIWTVGHSSRSLDEFLDLLGAPGIERVADIRRFPGSRAHPHFNTDALAAALASVGIRYDHVPELGGRRRPDPHSRNTVWRNASFRAYADYMETPAFSDALERLTGRALEARTAIMCSEAVWWRCHRSLVADALKAQGAMVFHLMESGKAVEHPFTSAARLDGGRLVYRPAPEATS